MKRLPKMTRQFAKIAVAFCAINAGTSPAYAMSKESSQRLAEMQLEASQELKALRASFTKRIAVYKSAEIKFDDGPALVAEDAPATPAEATSTIAVAGVEH